MFIDHLHYSSQSVFDSLNKAEKIAIIESFNHLREAVEKKKVSIVNNTQILKEYRYEFDEKQWNLVRYLSVDFILKPPKMVPAIIRINLDPAKRRTD